MESTKSTPVPPKALIQELYYDGGCSDADVIKRAASWGADEQLRLCVEWLENYPDTRRYGATLHAAMRPKTSIKQQALKALDSGTPMGSFGGLEYAYTAEQIDHIRCALKALPDNSVCHAHRDGECHWNLCPQVAQGEPARSGRHCPLDTEGQNND